MRVDLLPGNDGVIQSVDNVNNGPPVGTTSLVQNPGANPNILIKNLKEGSNITITDNGTDLEIAATSTLPNSDLANLGVGEQILATSGVLPVTNTRNFKTLLAGSNITLTPTANDITISATGGSNIYNANGSLTSARTLTLNSNNLNFTGTGNFTLDNTGTVNLGTANSTAVTVGRNGVQTILPAANIVLSNIPIDPRTEPGTILTFDTASKVVRYSFLTFNKALFSVGLNPFTIAGPFAALYNVPSTMGRTLSTLEPTNHAGYSTVGATLNLGTGVYSPSQTNIYEITIMLSVKNDLEVPDFRIEVRNVVGAFAISECKCTGGQINKYNTYVLSDRLQLSAAQLYVVRLYLNNGAATTYDFERYVWSVNLV